MKRSEYTQIERFMLNVLLGRLFDLLVNRKMIKLRVHLHKSIDFHVTIKDTETQICKITLDSKYELPDFERYTSSSNTGTDLISRISYRLYDDYKNPNSRLVPIYMDYFSLRALRKRDRTEHEFVFKIETKEHERD